MEMIKKLKNFEITTWQDEHSEGKSAKRAKSAEKSPLDQLNEIFSDWDLHVCLVVSFFQFSSGHTISHASKDILFPAFLVK